MIKRNGKETNKRQRMLTETVVQRRLLYAFNDFISNKQPFRISLD